MCRKINYQSKQVSSRAGYPLTVTKGVAHATTGTTMVVPLLENCSPLETKSDEKYGNSDNYYYNIMVL